MAAEPVTACDPPPHGWGVRWREAGSDAIVHQYNRQTEKLQEGSRANSLPAVSDPPPAPDPSSDARASAAGTTPRPAPQDAVGAIDGITRFMGMRWEDPQTVRLTIRPELINRGGLLSGVATYALVDYCMGSARRG